MLALVAEEDVQEKVAEASDMVLTMPNPANGLGGARFVAEEHRTFASFQWLKAQKKAAEEAYYEQAGDQGWYQRYELLSSSP